MSVIHLEKTEKRKKIRGKIQTYFDQMKDPTTDNKITQSKLFDWGDTSTL